MAAAVKNARTRREAEERSAGKRRGGDHRAGAELVGGLQARGVAGRRDCTDRLHHPEMRQPVGRAVERLQDEGRCRQRGEGEKRPADQRRDAAGDDEPPRAPAGQEQLRDPEHDDLGCDAVGPERPDQHAAETRSLPVERAERVEDPVRRRAPAWRRSAPAAGSGRQRPSAARTFPPPRGGAATRGARSASSTAAK